MIIAGDCTKVRKRLTFSQTFGSHILGTDLPLSECSVNNTENIEVVISRANNEKRIVSQTRAILIKVQFL